MAEYQVLASEPRHRVDAFVDEMLTRGRAAVADLGPALERLLRDMVEQFQAFRARHALLTLDAVRFEWIRWLRDEGVLVIEFSADPHATPPRDPAWQRDAVVDAFVDEVVGRAVPTALRDEFGQFARGMVWQFAALRKDAPIDLARVAFERIRWIDDRHLAIGLTHRGAPLRPRPVGWL
jgi:hypothetical protein